MAFQKETNLTVTSDVINTSDKHEFMIFYDDDFYEIRCEGNFPDSVFSALIKVKSLFGGKLFYEGEEWNGEDVEAVTKAKPLEKMWLVLAIIFFPITLIYLFLRITILVPFRLWKATR